MPRRPPPPYHPVGTLNAHALLTEADIPVIRRLYRRGERAVDVGRRFGVGERTIYRIMSGKSWSHVREETP